MEYCYQLCGNVYSDLHLLYISLIYFNNLGKVYVGLLCDLPIMVLVELVCLLIYLTCTGIFSVCGNGQGIEQQQLPDTTGY